MPWSYSKAFTNGSYASALSAPGGLPLTGVLRIGISMPPQIATNQSVADTSITTYLFMLLS